MRDNVPDYNDLVDAYEAEQERRLKKYPKCEMCHERITDDRLYVVGGVTMCRECLEYEYGRDTEDYIEE